MSASLSSKRRERRVASLVSPQFLVFALAVLLAIAADAQARDRKPPIFAGIKSATTCIPGPIGPGRTSSYHLQLGTSQGQHDASQQDRLQHLSGHHAGRRELLDADIHERSWRHLIQYPTTLVDRNVLLRGTRAR